MRLIDTETGAELVMGQIVTSFRGEEAFYAGGTPPHKPSSTGRITVGDRHPGKPHVFDSGPAPRYNTFFPSVYGAKWVE